MIFIKLDHHLELQTTFGESNENSVMKRPERKWTYRYDGLFEKLTTVILGSQDLD